jgi:hypothetical protein
MTRTDQSFEDFVNSIGGNLRAGLPGKLFQTAGLASIGGAAQGGGVGAFNPLAAAGIVEPKDTETSKINTPKPNTIF